MGWGLDDPSEGGGAAGTAEDEADDARTLSVLYDEQGERWRPWRKVAASSSENFYEDWPIEGPRTCQWLLKHIERAGGSPTQWHHRFLAESKVASTDSISI